MHDQEGDHDRLRGEAEFAAAVRGGDADDGLDAVVVEEEGDEEKEHAGEAREVSENVPGAASADADGGGDLGNGSAGFGDGLSVAEVAEGVAGESDPPESGGEEGEADGENLVDAELGVEGDQGEREGELDAAADVSVGETASGSAVDEFGRDDVGEKGIVEDVAGGVADLGENEESEREPDGSGLREKEEGGEKAAAGGEGDKELFAQSGVVGNGSEERGEEKNDDRGGGHSVGPERGGGNRFAEDDGSFGSDLLDEENGEERGGGGDLVAVGGPVVKAPGAHVFSIRGRGLHGEELNGSGSGGASAEVLGTGRVCLVGKSGRDGMCGLTAGGEINRVR